MCALSVDKNKIVSYFIHRIKGVLLLLIIVLSLELTTMPTASLELSEELKASNHAYPVYNVLTLTLNNRSNDQLQSQIMLYNATTGEWFLNEPLLELIRRDLNVLSSKISDIQQFYLYEWNDSYLPGEVYVWVDVSFADAQEAITTAISLMVSDKDTWWYLANVSFPIFDLHEYYGTGGEFGGDFSYLVVDTLTLYTGQTYFTHTNNTVQHFICRERDGVNASFFNYNGSEWVINYAFVTVFNHSLNELETHLWSRYQCNFSYVSLEKVLSLINNSTNLLLPGDVIIQTNIFLIYQNQTLSRTEELRRYFMFRALFSRMWYCAELESVEIEIHYFGNSLPYYLYSSIPGLILITVVIISRFRKKRKGM